MASSFLAFDESSLEIDAQNPPSSFTLTEGFLYAKAESYKSLFSFDTAVFYAERLMSKLGDDIAIDFDREDGASKLALLKKKTVLLLAECLFSMGQFRHCVFLLKKHKIVQTDDAALALALRCLIQGAEYEEALELLSRREYEWDHSTPIQSLDKIVDLNDFCHKTSVIKGWPWNAEIELSRGRLHAALDNRPVALSCFMRSLFLDPALFQSFDLLHDSLLLSPDQERKLISLLPFKEQDEPIRLLYHSKLAIKDIQDYKQIYQLEERLDLPNDVYLDTCKAQAEVQLFNYPTALELTTKILEKDPFQTGDPQLLHITSLFELNKKNELFIHAHHLSKQFPHQSIVLYGVACYYASINKHDQAKRYLNKITRDDSTTDSSNGMGKIKIAAWIAFGHIFAKHSESDHALASYRLTMRFLQGSHLPYLFTGMELNRTSNWIQSSQMLQRALSICDFDPLVHNEIGVIALEGRKNYVLAEKKFSKAVNLCGPNPSSKMFPIFVNHGHSLRKLRRFQDALEAYKKALELAPLVSLTLSSMGFTYFLMEDPLSAIKYYQQSLSIDSADPFTVQALEIAVSSDSTNKSFWMLFD